MGGNYVNGKCRPFVVTRVLVGIMRPGGEVFLLKWEYIDCHTRTIFIPFGKTANARRRVAMTQRMADALLARECWLAEVTRSVLRKSHLRHTRAETYGSLVGGDEGDGHSSPQVTMVYLHPGLDAIRAAMENNHAETLQRRKLRHNPGEGSPEQHASR